VEIVIAAPTFIPWAVLGLDVVAVASLLLKKGQLVRRIAGMAIVAVVSVVLLVFLYRPSRFALTPVALVDATYGRTITTSWSEVKRAFLVRGFEQGEYRPVARTNGAALPNLRTGWFRLANGRTARVLAQSSPDALILETDRVLYVLAPDRLQELVAGAREHVNVTE
jgi:hypothetical protein